MIGSLVFFFFAFVAYFCPSFHPSVSFSDCSCVFRGTVTRTNPLNSRKDQTIHYYFAVHLAAGPKTIQSIQSRICAARSSVELAVRDIYQSLCTYRRALFWKCASPDDKSKFSTHIYHREHAIAARHAECRGRRETMRKWNDGWLSGVPSPVRTTQNGKKWRNARERFSSF